MEVIDRPAPVAIAVAPNGGRRGRADHPALPLTPGELAATAVECRDAGAALIHLHVRNGQGGHVLDLGAYREAIAAVRESVGDRLVVQVTTESLGRYSPAAQIALVRDLKPEAASLALRELAPGEAEEAGFIDLLVWMRASGVFPQIILYDPAEAVRLAQVLEGAGIDWRGMPVLFVLGRYASNQQGHPANLLPFLAPDIPRYAHWSVCAFGSEEAACVAAGALLGGHIRVGFENNLRLPDGSVAGSNADLVRSAAHLVTSAGGRCATADDLRQAWAAVVPTSRRP